MFGLPEEDLVGRPLHELGADPDDPVVATHLAALRAPGDRAECRWVLRGADGTPSTATLTSSVVADSSPEAAPLPGGGTGLVVTYVVDVSEQERHETRLAHLATHDPLTGLPNRRAFEAALESHMERRRRYGDTGAVLMLDLDHFKEVNDSIGHAAGDHLVVRLSNVLQRRVRASDMVARIGGDEFAVLLEETDLAGARQVAEDLVARVRAETASLDGAQRRVTVSIGMVMTEAGLEAGEVMSKVDLMLYDAKDAGRDRVEVLDPVAPDSSRTGSRILWTGRIDQALREDRFELHLQPILDLQTGRISNAEALIRMRLDDRLVSPAEFLPVAERTDMILGIDRWVLEHSVPLLRELQAVDPGFVLEVNLSGRSVEDPSVASLLARLLEDHQVDPQGLVIEITETVAVARMSEAQEFSRRISDLGCRFALDDFGAGFGSFYYLKHLAFDFLKIDGESVSTCDVSARDRIILGSIVDLADRLGKRTIAEFVSSDSILEVVRAEGVDYAQGFHVGRPVPSSVLLADLRAHLHAEGRRVAV